MAASKVLQVVIVGDSASAQRAFEKTGLAAGAAAKAADKASSSFERTGARMSTLGGKVEGVGKKLSTHLTLPILAVGGAAVKMSLDFQKAMLLVETHTETSHKMVERYKKALLEMSASGRYTQGPKELADAMYHIASDGYKGEKALTALKESANLAMLGQSELAETTYAVVSAMKTGIKGTQNLHEAIGTLNGTMGAGDTKMDELTAALSTGVVTAARAAGLELKDVGAALAFMTARGVPAQKAAYGLSMNFQQIVPYTKKAREAFESIGLGFDELGKKASSGPEGWLHALEDLKAHLSGLDKFGQTQVVEEIFGGGRTSRGVLAQLQNLKDLGATYERVGVIAGRTDKNLSIARKSEANTWKEEWAKIQSAMVELGNALTPVVIPALKQIAGLVTGIARGFEKLPKPMQNLVIGAGLALAALGPLLKIGGNLLKVFGGVASMVGKIGRGIGVVEAEQAAAGVAGATGGVARSVEGTAAGAAGSRWLGQVTGGVGGAVTGAAAQYAGAESAASYARLTGAAEGAAAGAFGEKAALGASGLFDIGGATATAISSAATVLGGVAGGYFAAEFGAEAIEGITGADLLENQDLKTSLTHGFNTSHVAQTEKEALAENKAREAGIHPGLGPHGKELKGLERAFEETMKRLGSDTAGGMKVINADMKAGLVNASQIWSTGTQPWRQHTAEAMEAAVAAIRKGMHDGSINAERGQKEINGLLERIHVIKGDDPFGLAKATAKSFIAAGKISERGVQKWASNLAQMPTAARKSTIDATNKILQGWAQGHPKIERQIESLTTFEVTHFGATNKQLREGVQKGATGPIAEAFQEAARGVGGALTNIGTNTSAMLKALGLHDIVEFQALVLGPSRLGPTTGPQGGQTHQHTAPGSYHGKGRQERYSGGPITRPMAIVGEEAPQHHEWVIATNPAYRRNNVGYWMQAGHDLGIPGFAKGGGFSATVKGPGKLAEIGHAALAKVMGAAGSFIHSHEPKPTPGGAGAGTYGGKTPAGVGTFQGFPVDNWIIPELEYAVAHGWTGHITSGYRTPQHSAELGFPGDEHTKTSYPGGAVDFGGMQDPAGAANRAAFIAATAGYKGPRLHLPIGFRDDGHMSGTGHYKGGLAYFAKGGNTRGHARDGVTKTHRHILHELARATKGYGTLQYDEDNLRNWIEVWNQEPRSIRMYNGAATRKWLSAKLPAGYWTDSFDFIRGHREKRSAEPVMARMGGVIAGFAKGGRFGSGLTVKGQAASPQQIRVAEEIAKAGDATSANHLARVAAFMAATQESDMGAATPNTFELIGPFEGVTPSSGTYRQAVQWFSKGYYNGPLGGGGGIALTKKTHDPGLIAQEVEGSAYPELYKQWKSEGQAWTDAWTGGGSGRAAGGGANKKQAFEGGKYGKGKTSGSGGTSAGFAPKSAIQAAQKMGAAHAANPTLSENIPKSKLPSWAAGLPRYQREELEGRGTTFSERESILGGAESNADFGAGVAGRSFEKAMTAYSAHPSTGTWTGVTAASGRVQVQRQAQTAAANARKKFEQGYIAHLTVGIKKINWQLAHAAGKLNVKQVAALKAKRAELVSLRAAARGESQSAVENLENYTAAGEAEAAEMEQSGPMGKLAEGFNSLIEDNTIGEAFQKQMEEMRTRPMEEIEAGLALAELTPGTGDDLAALEREKALAQERLAGAQLFENLPEITEWAHTLKGVEDAIGSLTGGGNLGQVAEEMKSLREALEQQTKFAEAAIATNSATAWKALADIMSGQLGARGNHQAQLAGNGSLGTV